MTAGRKVITDKKDWGTPKFYVDAVKKVFKGKIDLDPCTNKYSVVSAKTEFQFPKHNGLTEEWNYPTIFVNPPYGKDAESGTTIFSWLKKCAESHEKFNSEVIALVPVAVNTSHWKEFVFGKARSICFLYDTRLRFLIKGKDLGKGAPMACAMVYWGKNYTKFFNVFIKFGAVTDISNLQKINVGSKQKLIRKK
tara:strand:- start:159 stop:740 length:582 start_codon:yes stop_codon:yes gene_type:complete